MKFQCIDEVGHPLEKVFGLLRDEMTLLVPYLNDVEGIEVTEREDLPDGQVRIVNLWKGSNAKAPRMVRKFLSPELICWKKRRLKRRMVSWRESWRCRLTARLVTSSMSSS